MEASNDKYFVLKALVLNGTGSQLKLQLMNTDSIHHNLYTCRGYNNSSVFGESNVTTIVIGNYNL